MNKPTRVLFIFLISIFTSFVAHAVDRGEVYKLIIESCRYYGGEKLSELQDPISRAIDNPLLQSPLGKRTYSKNYKNASQYMYFSSDKNIQLINNSPELEQALDRCYGNDEQAKFNFIFLMNQIQYEAKATAFTVELGTWAIGFGLFSKIATKLSTLKYMPRFFATPQFAKWSTRVMIAMAATQFSAVLHKYIQYRKGELKTKELSLKTITDAGQFKAANARVEKEKQALNELENFATQDLQNQINQLMRAFQDEKDPAKKKELKALIDQSTVILNNLKSN